MKKAYYKRSNCTLYQGDYISMLKEIKANSISMIYADPPYFLSDVSNDFKKKLKFNKAWIKDCKRILKPEGTIWVKGKNHSIYQCGFALQSAGFHILNDIVLFKPDASPDLSCRVFTTSHEAIIWAKKEKKAKHTFNYGIMKNGKWQEDNIKKEGKQMRSVWSIPTTKPEDLLKRIILASTKEGDKILDPFTGSSTTGILASKYNREFIGIDTLDGYTQDFKQQRLTINYA